MRRIILLSFLWTLPFVAIALGIWQFGSSGYSTPRVGHSEAGTAGAGSGDAAGGINPYAVIPIGLATVAGIFGLDIAVMWALRKIGGEKLKADVKATISKFGGNIVIAGGGLLGCFLAIASVAFGGLYLVSTIINK